MQTTPSNHTIKLLALDLDGTVLDDTFRISKRVLSALEAAVARGVRVTIATGRPIPVTQPFVKALRVNAPVIAMQGGIIHDFATDTTLHALSLPVGLAGKLIRLEERFPAWQVVLYAGSEMYVSSIRYPMDFYAALLGSNLTVQPALAATLQHYVLDKVLFIIPAEDATLSLRELKVITGDQAVVVQSHALFVEVNPPGAHKGAGLARLAELLNIPRESVMAIGDQDNDATMVEWAGMGIAMGNGSPATKAAADWIAPSIAEDGAAVAIERFILNGR